MRSVRLPIRVAKCLNTLIKIWTSTEKTCRSTLSLVSLFKNQRNQLLSYIILMDAFLTSSTTFSTKRRTQSRFSLCTTTTTTPKWRDSSALATTLNQWSVSITLRICIILRKFTTTKLATSHLVSLVLATLRKLANSILIANSLLISLSKGMILVNVPLWIFTGPKEYHMSL